MNYINEHKNILTEGVLIDTLPFDIVSSIVNNSTSLGCNPAIPDIYNVPYLSKIANDRFHELVWELKNIGELNDVKSNEINGALSELINKCKEIERPYRSELENICFNLVSNIFNVPSEMIDVEISLKDEITLDGNVFKIDPINDNIDNELIDVNDALDLKKEVYKRRLLLTLIMGASMNISFTLSSLEKEIMKISPELCDLYKKIFLLNNYLLFIKEDIGITDKTPKQIGYVNVIIGQETEKIKILTEAEIFPVLLSELIRGFMEIFISHGLPKNRKRAKMIIDRTDFLKSEPWDMRLGPTLWKILSNSFNDITLRELPYLLKRLSSLEIDKFNFLMKEVFAKTKKGRNIMSFISNKAKDDMAYDKFIDKIEKRKKDKGVITDEYIHSDEL